MTGEAVARVKNVSHRYGATVSLADVSIDIPSRIMVGVIGPDGVGKSTLLGLIAGVKVIQSGEVVVFDKTIANKETLRDIRGRIAYMPQGLGRNLYPTLSVFENIDFFGRLFGLSAAERRTKIDELLTATSLEKFEARPAGKLSGGIVTLAREERERTIRGADFHAAATTSRHVLIAAARKTRCDRADVRLRWTLKVLYTPAWGARRTAQAYGYNGLNFRELADEVGIKAASIYHHFPSKVDLGAAVAKCYWQDTRADLEAMSTEISKPLDLLPRVHKNFRC